MASTSRMLSGGEDGSLSHASLAKIIGTGILLGVVHVLTGPDHLSALAAMTTGSSWRAFTLGIRWGCGHSLGLLIMAVIFFAAGRSFNLDHVGVYCNYVVGVFMIALGVWTMVQVKRKYRDKLKGGDAPPLRCQRRSTPVAVTMAPLATRRSSADSPSSSAVVVAADPQLPTTTTPGRTVSGNSKNSIGSPQQTNTAYQLLQDDKEDVHVHDETCLDQLEAAEHAHEHNHIPKCCQRYDFSSPTAQRLTALMVGIIHGIAGPGGILGVLPAVVMDDWGKSTAYLASFCLASIFIMGVFAALYGEITGRLSRNSTLIEFRLGIFSASFSLIVGIAWILLQATGQLDKVFE